MRIYLFVFVSFFIGELLAQSQVHGIAHQGEKLDFRVTLPKNFQNNKTYPLLLVPGFESPNEPYSLYIGDMPSSYDWIIVESVINIKSALTNELINFIKSSYPIGDVYISGFSANSIPMFKLIKEHPNLFVGAIAMPGYANGIDRTVFESNPELKIILIVGENDTYWKNQAGSAFQRLRSIGFDTSLHIIPGQGHRLMGLRGKPFFDLLHKRLKL